MFSVALSLGSPPVGVTDHPALRSPDFPPRPPCGGRSDHPALSGRTHATAYAPIVQHHESHESAVDPKAGSLYIWSSLYIQEEYQ